MQALLIAEKPDLMRQIQAVYNKHTKEIKYNINFISQRGHLLTLMLPSEMDEEQKKWSWENIPFDPADYGGWKYRPIEEKKTGKFLTAKERLANIDKEIKSGNYDFIINAGDPDQEGELLIRIVLDYLGCRLPVKRFWTNDLTEAHILNALLNLRDDDHDPMLVNLLQAAYGRQHSDYRFGMNITEAASLKMGGTVKCGRVKTPLLAIVCKREDEIRNYVEKTVYGVQADYTEGFAGKLTEDEKLVWFESQTEAENAFSALPKTAAVKRCEEKEKKTYPPKLFKLATLQIEAGKLGYNDKTTLDVIQKLYEGQYLSYPRTDCEYLSSDENFKGILGALAPFITEKIGDDAISCVIKSSRWVNDKALEKSGHSAIRPTTKVPELDGLSQAERDIYKLVADRFLSIFYPPMIQKERKLVATIGDKEFTSTGKEVISPGFTAFLHNTPANTAIPYKKEGDVLQVEKFGITTKTTEKPKRFTSPELIAICENPQKYSESKGDFKIGTPATRSGIIRQLIDKDHYLEEKKEGKRTVLRPTKTGEIIIKNLGDLSICKVDMTGEWEESLQKVRDGEKGLEALEAEMKNAVEKMILDIKNREVTGLENVLMDCPVCGQKIIKGSKGYYCRNCRMGIFTNFIGHTFSKEEAAALFRGETIKVDLKTAEKAWTQKIKYNFDEKKIDFVKAEKRETDFTCPLCGGKIYETEKAFSCRCGLVVWRDVCGHHLTEEEAESLFKTGKTETIKDFKSKKGKTFSASLLLNEDAKRTAFQYA